MWPSYCENAKNRSFPGDALSICIVARGVICEFLKHFSLFGASQFSAFAQGRRLAVLGRS